MCRKIEISKNRTTTSAINQSNRLLILNYKLHDFGASRVTMVSIESDISEKERERIAYFLFLRLNS